MDDCVNSTCDINILTIYQHTDVTLQTLYLMHIAIYGIALLLGDEVEATYMYSLTWPDLPGRKSRVWGHKTNIHVLIPEP